MLSVPRVLDARYQGEHPQTPEAVLLGNIGAGEERFLIGRHDDSERPPAATGKHLANVHVDAVNVRPLLAVHLNGDERLIHQAGDFEVLEGFALHNVAPVAGGVANRKKNRLLLLPGLVESLGSPGIPIHRVVGMLEKIRTLLVNETIRMFFSRQADVPCHNGLVSQGVDQTSRRHSDYGEQSRPNRGRASELPHLYFAALSRCFCAELQVRRSCAYRRTSSTCRSERSILSCGSFTTSNSFERPESTSWMNFRGPSRRPSMPKE